MTKVFICGQAPSRQGDGRPFVGPSGNRLAALLLLRDYEDLRSRVDLINIFDVPAESLGDRGDAFDRIAARERAQAMLREWLELDERITVIACGHQVFHAFTGVRGRFYRGRKLGNVSIWCIPHPSGASAYWNKPENTLIASKFLIKLLKRSGIALDE